MRGDRWSFQVSLYLGASLKIDRHAAGLTREQLIERMPEPIHPQTLATYEKGLRSMTIERYLEICAGLEVSAPDTLQVAIDRTDAPDSGKISQRFDHQSRRLATQLRAIADELCPPNPAREGAPYPSEGKRSG